MSAATVSTRAPADRLTQEGEPHPGCQRTFARTGAERARKRGVDLRMAFEVGEERAARPPLTEAVA